MAGGADLIMTGDSDLLAIGSYLGIGIVSAAAALTAIELTGKT